MKTLPALPVALIAACITFSAASQAAPRDHDRHHDQVRHYASDRHYDRDDNPPGRRGGPGTNWENPPGWRGGPGASPDYRSWNHSGKRYRFNRSTNGYYFSKA